MKKGKKPTGKKPQPHQDVPSGWRDKLEDFCRTNWRKHAKPGEAFDLAAFTGISRKTIFNAKRNGWFTKSMFATLAQAVGCGTQTELLRILSPPSTTAVSRPASENPHEPHDILLDKELLTDHLVGVSFSDRGTRAEWNFGFSCAKKRLKEKPEDTYLRAILVWSTLLKGDPDQIIDVVQDAATWLQSDEPFDSDHNVEQRKELWLKKITGIRDETVKDAAFVRRVLEDTLVREAFLRWLKSAGKFSALAERFRTIETQGIPHTAKKILVRHQSEVDWVAGAIKETNIWISAEHHRGLAKLFLIWLTGRDPGRNEIASVIKKSLDWLDHHPGINDTLVRWGSIWLAGMSEDEQFTKPIIDRTSRWLQSPASKGDRLVRTALLWFAGEQGNAQQVNDVIAQNSKWLDAPSNRKDNCIRIALLFCIRRAIERGESKPKQLQTEIGKFPLQIRKDQLIDLAVTLAECPLAITFSPIARPTASRLKRDL